MFHIQIINDLKDMWSISCANTHHDVMIFVGMVQNILKNTSRKKHNFSMKQKNSEIVFPKSSFFSGGSLSQIFASKLQARGDQ